MKNSKKLWLVLFLTVSMLVVSGCLFAVSAADGYEITGWYGTDNIGLETTVELVHDGTVVKTTTIPAFEDSYGEGAVNFWVTDVQPGTYDLVFKKAGCLSYTVTGITVINSDVNLSNSSLTSGANKPNLISGDIDENGFVDGIDVSYFIFDMGKSDAEAIYATSDLNGDGYRDGIDVAKLAFNMLSQPGSVEYDNPHINVVKNIFNFNELNPNGSFWWGLVHPTLSEDGYKGNCYTTNVGNDIICGNLGAEGTSVDFSALAEDGNYLSFYVYVESDITTTLRTDVVSIRDVYSDPCSLIWNTTGLTKGWNHIILDIDDVINHGANFDIENVQFVHFWLGTDETNWCVDELSIIEIEDYNQDSGSGEAPGDEHEHDAATNLTITDAVGPITSGADIVMFAGAIGPYDLTDYQANGGVHIELYVSDPALIANGQLELSSNSAPDTKEINWKFDGKQFQLKEGWNVLDLKFSEIPEVEQWEASFGGMDWSAVNYCRIYLNPTNTEDKTVELKNVYIFKGEAGTEPDAPEDPEDPPVGEGTKFVLTACDSIDGLWGSPLALDTQNKVEGTASVSASSNSDNVAIICEAFGSGYDLSEYQDDMFVHLSVYIDDISKMITSPGHIQFELYGGDPVDNGNGQQVAPCFRWNIGSMLDTGWNEIELSFSSAVIDDVGGRATPSIATIKSHRLFGYSTAPTTIAIDDIYVTTSATLAKKYANNLFKLDNMSAYSDSSYYSKAAWTVSGASASFSSEGAKLHDTGAVTLNVASGQTAVLCKTFSNTDLSKYADDGYLYFWLYVDKASKITGGQLELTSSTQPDCYETSWNVTSLNLKDGWNEIKLSLKDSNFASNDAIWSIINYVRFYFSVNAQTTIKVEGLYFGTADDMETVQANKVETSRDVLVLENCDTLDNWAVVGTSSCIYDTSSANAEHEGTGYITTSLDSAGDVVLAKTYQATDHWMNAVNATVNTWRIDLREYKDSKLNVSMYISDPSVVIGGQIELTSSGRSDANEISWGELGVNIPLKAGWNHLELDFADANIIGNPDYFEINYFRAYLNCSGAITMGLDNIYFGDTQELSSVIFTDGTNTLSRAYYKDGSRIRLSTSFYNYDKEFNGWSDGTNLYKQGEYVTVNGDVTYTAVTNDRPVDNNVYYSYDMDDGGYDSPNRVKLNGAVKGACSATGYNVAWIKSDVFGRVLDLSTNGSSVQPFETVSVPMSSDVAVETWFNAPKRTATKGSTLLDRYIMQSDGIGIWLDPDDSSVNVRVGSTTVTATKTDIGFDVIDEKWHYICVKYDASDARVTVYIDGNSVKSATVSVSGELGAVVIGAYSHNSAANCNFDGHLARFAITNGNEFYGYSSSLITEAEYDASTSIKLEKGIVIDRRQYWNFNPFTYEGATIAPNDIQNIKSLGFDHVKLLLTPNWLIDDNGELIYENMTYIAPILDEVQRQGFKCILCLHPEEGFKGTYMSEAAFYNGKFSDLLNFYQDFTAYVVENWGTDFIAIQLMTEPNANSSSVSWDWIADRHWVAARNASEDIMLITSSDDFGNFEHIKHMSPVFDYNLVYSFTTYEPYTVGFNNYNQYDFWPYVKGVLYPVPEGLTSSQISALIEENITMVPNDLKESARYTLRRYYTGEADIWRINSYDQVYNLDWHMERCAALDAWNQANGGNIHLMAVEFGCSDTQYNQKIFHAVAGSGISDETRLTLIDHQTSSFEAYGIGWSYWSYNEYFHMLDTTKHLNLGNVCLTPIQFADAVDQKLIDILLNRN